MYVDEHVGQLCPSIVSQSIDGVVCAVSVRVHVIRNPAGVSVLLLCVLVRVGWWPLCVGGHVGEAHSRHCQDGRGGGPCPGDSHDGTIRRAAALNQPWLSRNLGCGVVVCLWWYLQRRPASSKRQGFRERVLADKMAVTSSPSPKDCFADGRDRVRDRGDADDDIAPATSSSVSPTLASDD